MITWLIVALTLLSVGTTYLFWIRPILKKQPTFAEFYAQEDTLWAALSAKFGGLKQRLTTAIVFIAGFVVEAYDFLAPLISQSGVDVTTILPKIPPQVWPLISMGILALVMYFRRLSDKRNAAAIVEAAQTGEIPKGVPLPVLPTLPPTGSQ